MSGKKSTITVHVEILLAKFMIWIFQTLSQKSALKLAGHIGVIFHDLVGIRKRVAYQQLSEAFPDKNSDWVSKTLRKVYQNMAMVAAELARIPKL